MLNLCTIEHALVIMSAAAAFVAAVTWLRASLVKVPALPAQFSNLDDLFAAVGHQSRLNALAPLFAGLAALLQLPQAFMPTCWG